MAKTIRLAQWNSKTIVKETKTCPFSKSLFAPFFWPLLCWHLQTLTPITRIPAPRLLAAVALAAIAQEQAPTE
jgi:hypothetical protein